MLNLSAKYRRIAALLMDMLLINGIATLLGKLMLIYLVTKQGMNIDNQTFTFVFLTLLFMSIIATLYVVICQLIFKGTLGKRLLGVELVDLNGDALSMPALISREWSKWILIYFFSVIVILINAILYFSNGTSLHDKLSKTKVI